MSLFETWASFAILCWLSIGIFITVFFAPGIISNFLAYVGDGIKSILNRIYSSTGKSE